MKKIAIVGCGGINSWFVEHLHTLIGQFFEPGKVYVKIFDKDLIEEKNLLRGNQNFKVSDLMEEKAKVLATRFNFDFEETFINEDNIKKLEIFDDVILGVDNNKVRRLVYDYCIKNNKYLLDMRAQGTQVAFYIVDKEKGMTYYDEKLFANKDVMERKGSCQLQHDVDNDHIENGNRLIAFMGAVCIYLKRLRGEEVSTNDWKWVY